MHISIASKRYSFGDIHALSFNTLPRRIVMVASTFQVFHDLLLLVSPAKR
jgi:hypothetical protein